MKSFVKWAVLAASLGALSAAATTMLRADVDELTRGSDAVVTGRVVRTESRWTSDRMRIVTDVEVEVAESWKGAPPKTVTLVQPGGQVGDIGQLVSGLASFRQGEQVVVFLRQYGKDRFVLHGMGQGKYRIEKSKDGKTEVAVPEDLGDAVLLDRTTRQAVKPERPQVPLDELRNQVRSAAQGPKQ